jgi:hypothetical protein
MPDIMFSIIDIMLGGGWMSKYTLPIFMVYALTASGSCIVPTPARSSSRAT